MRLQHISYLCVKVIAIVIFLLGLNHLMNLIQYSIPSYMQIIEHLSFFEAFLMVGFPACFLIVVSIILWFSANRLSVYLIPKAEPTEESADTSGVKQLEGYILAVIGLLLVVFSLTTIIRMLLTYTVFSTEQGFAVTNQIQLYSIVEQGLRFIIGLVLLVKAEGFARLLRKIRTLGVKE